MRFFLFFLAAMLMSTAIQAAQVAITPSAISAGGVALVRWTGEGASAGTVLFEDTKIPLELDSQGGVAVIGADLDTPPGRYRVAVTVTDAEGQTRTYEEELEIRSTEWPEERLTLPSEMVTPKKPEVVERILAEQKLLRDLFDEVTPLLLQDEFRRPVQDPLGSAFGLRRVLNGEPRSPHAGVDFRTPEGTDVLASGRGQVVFAGDLYFTGQTVVLDHGGGFFSLYAHLRKVSCQEGDLLQTGDVLGVSGSSGRSTGPHLHWGVKWRGGRIDPLALVNLYRGKGLDSPN